MGREGVKLSLHFLLFFTSEFCLSVCLFVWPCLAYERLYVHMLMMLCRSALTKLLCGLYALMLVVFGVVFAVADSLTVKERQHLYYLEVTNHTVFPTVLKL